MHKKTNKLIDKTQSNIQFTCFKNGRVIAIGTDEAVTKSEEFAIHPSKSLYYDLTRTDINRIMYRVMDTVSKTIVYKDIGSVGQTNEIYKNRSGDLIQIEDCTDEEILSVLSNVQTYFRNSWTPKMMLKKIRYSDFY